MKKLMIALAAAGLSAAAYAQEMVEVVEVPADKYSVATNSFWSNWFVEAGADYSAFYSNQEIDVSKNPFKPMRRAYGFDVAAGKWFTPGLGLRTKFNGIWGKQVNSPSSSGKFDYLHLHEDVLFNLSNMLCGYSETRVWNAIPFAGMGVARNCSADNYSVTVNVGLLNTWRLTDRLKVHFELAMMFAEKDFDGTTEPMIQGRSVWKRGWRGFDKALTASVGVTVNLGRNTGFRRVPNVDALMALNAAQLEAMNAALADQQTENARLKSELAARPDVCETKACTDTIREVMVAPQSVFFHIGSSEIACRKEIVNLRALADMAKQTGTRLRVTGYADSATGSAAWNRTLSEARAETVADELEKLGVSRDHLIVEGKGGVDTLQPISYNRRVIIEAE